MSDTISLWGLVVPSVLASAVGALTSLLVKHQLAKDIKAIEGRQQHDGEAFRLAHSPRVTAAIKLWSAYCEFERWTAVAMNPFAVLYEPATGTREEKDSAMKEQPREREEAKQKRVGAAWEVLKGARDEAECLIDEATFTKFNELFQLHDKAYGRVWATRATGGDVTEMVKATVAGMFSLKDAGSLRAEVAAAMRRAIAGESA